MKKLIASVLSASIATFSFVNSSLAADIVSFTDIMPKYYTAFQAGQSVTVQKTFLPRAVAPPARDIAVSNTNSSPALIDLGTQERVPRLVLRDAPVNEVLALLARAAGLNLAYTADRLKVTLDIQDESVQVVFNTVLRITGLQAYREGNTIFINSRLPNDAHNTNRCPKSHSSQVKTKSYLSRVLNKS